MVPKAEKRCARTVLIERVNLPILAERAGCHQGHSAHACRRGYCLQRQFKCSVSRMV